MLSQINNIVSNLKNSSSQANSKYQKYKSPHSYNRITPGLTQGEKFIKYQNKIVKNLEKRIEYVNSKEGFENSLPNSLTSQTNMVLKKLNNLLQIILIE